MCGLVAVFSKKGKHTGDKVLSVYQKQGNRGKQGFGYLAISNGRIVSVERARSEHEISSRLRKERAELILFHHRMPTSTKNTVGTTHPIFVSHESLDYDYYFAHNGVISNASELKARHEKEGFEYTTEFVEETVARYSSGTVEKLEDGVHKFNDSEALAIELAKHVDGQSSKIDTRGSLAFWGVRVEKGGDKVLELYFGKNNGRDLKSETTKKWFIVSSETGKDLDPMKLFKISTGTEGFSISDLPVVDYTPPVTTSQTRTGFALPEPKKADSSGFVWLENRYYTWSEATDSGFPMSEFTMVNVENRVLYVPLAHIRDYAGRKPRLEWEKEQRDESVSRAQMSRLEELAIKIAEYEGKLDDVDAILMDANNDDEKTACRAEQYTLETKITECEERIAALSLPATVVDEALDLAREMESYNRSYNTSDYDKSEPITNLS